MSNETKVDLTNPQTCKQIAEALEAANLAMDDCQKCPANHPECTGLGGCIDVVLTHYGLDLPAVIAALREKGE